MLCFAYIFFQKWIKVVYKHMYKKITYNEI